ncbi:hypothetical protein FOZ63_015129, partial [Perkinsus olseni]
HHHHHHHHHHNKDSCPPLVRVVDLDCGQPDVALPGTISIDLCHEVRLYPGPTSVIHNPTTTTAGASTTHHQQQQQQQLYTGACTPALNPRDYVDKCCRLMDEAMRRDEGHEGSSSSPVLVNTPGWYGGLGGHILAYLRYYIQPHIVIVLGDKQQQQEHNHYWSDLCNGDNPLIPSPILLTPPPGRDIIIPSPSTSSVSSSNSRSSSSIHRPHLLPPPPQPKPADLRWLRYICYFQPHLRGNTNSWHTILPQQCFQHTNAKV